MGMKYFNKYQKVDGISKVKQLFVENGIIEECKKNTIFIHQDQIQKKAGFIIKGAFRYLRHTPDGREQIVGYSFEDDFVANYAAFQCQEPSATSAQAIKDCTIYTLTYDDLYSFFKEQDPDNLRAQIGETFLGDIYMRMISLYCDSPEERYLKLLERYPNIVNAITLKEIASFLKMTPETLSRIRKKITLT